MYGLELGCSVRRTGAAAYCAALRTACFTNFKTTDHEIPYLAFPASLRNTNRDPPIVSLKAAFIRRSIRQGFCAPDFANFSDIIDHADDDLFKQILSNPNHVLAPLLPDKTESHYSLDNSHLIDNSLQNSLNFNMIVISL